MHDIETMLRSAYGTSIISESPRKNWLMKRNCSLSTRQISWSTPLIIIPPFATAWFSVWQVAWLVLPGAGLEVAILGWALLYYARHASDYGHVWPEDDAHVIQQVSARRRKLADELSRCLGHG